MRQHTSVLHAGPADWVGLGAAVMAAIITKGASVGETGALTQGAEAAENAANYFFGTVGAVPGVVESTAKSGASPNPYEHAEKTFEREVVAGIAGYVAGGWLTL